MPFLGVGTASRAIGFILLNLIVAPQRGLQHGARALDAYVWLANRLPRVKRRNGDKVSWAALQGQFGADLEFTNLGDRPQVGRCRAIEGCRMAVNAALAKTPTPPQPRTTKVVRRTLE